MSQNFPQPWIAYAHKMALHLAERDMAGWPYERRVGYMLGYAYAHMPGGCGLPMLLEVVESKAALPFAIASPATATDYRALAELVKSALRRRLGHLRDENASDGPTVVGACCPGCLDLGQIQAGHFACSELREGELRNGAWIAEVSS